MSRRTDKRTQVNETAERTAPSPTPAQDSPETKVETEGHPSGPELEVSGSDAGEPGRTETRSDTTTRSGSADVDPPDVEEPSATPTRLARLDAAPITRADFERAMVAAVKAVVSGATAETSSRGERDDESDTPPRPTIIGPATYDRGQSDGPQFQVDALGQPFCGVELAQEPYLFASDSRGLRTDRVYYASWSDQGMRPASGDAVVFLLPEYVWNLFRLGDRIYYRVVTSSSGNGWENIQWSTPRNAIADAPYVALTGRPEKGDFSRFRPEEKLWRELNTRVD
jgi:hypothetical protein